MVGSGTEGQRNLLFYLVLARGHLQAFRAGDSRGTGFPTARTAAYHADGSGPDTSGSGSLLIRFKNPWYGMDYKFS